MFRQGCFLLTTLAFTVTLLACSSDGRKWDPEDYTVKSGDTVYSIAWRYELDPEEFASWNGIRASKHIKPGRRLHTRKPANFAASTNNRSTQTAYGNRSTFVTSSNKMVKARKGDTLYGLSKKHGVSVERLAQLNRLKKPYTIQSGQTIFLKPLESKANTRRKHSTTKTSASNRSRGNNSQTANSSTGHWPKSIRWQRPAKGKVVKKFDGRRNDAKGIDIAGRQGDTIVASAAGKVVYSGDGLISYGNLIIIKHNKTYLSAYAYNRKLIVKEGEAVKAGQKIAEMGHKDKQNTRLHFEIRKNGKPVDPLKYLPW